MQPKKSGVVTIKYLHVDDVHYTLDYRYMIGKALFLLLAITLTHFSLSAKVLKKHHHTATKQRTFHQRTANFIRKAADADNLIIDPDTLGHVYFSNLLHLNVDSLADMHLFHLIQTWIGTPYRLGGATRYGIDCSKFAGKIYTAIYNVMLGINCKDIFEKAEPLERDFLKEGDLVFFKIHGKNISHMGVYLGKDYFVHSSSSRGVTISSLNDPYYTRYFFKGGRVNLLTASTQ